MATTTPNLGLTKPDPNGDDDAWAPMLNGNADILDTQVKAAQDAAASANSNANGRVSKAGDTLTGTLTVAPASGTQAAVQATATGTATADMILSSAAGNRAGLRLRTGSADRWKLTKSTSAESGSNLGSDFGILRCSDAGAEIEFAFSLARSTGAATFARQVVVANNATIETGGAIMNGAPGDGFTANGFGTAPGPVYVVNLVSGNPNWGNVHHQAVHFPGVWVGHRFAIGGTVLADARNDGQWYKTGGGSWADISDERTKFAIQDFQQGLDAILALRPRVFSYRQETGRDPFRRYVGGIAQEVETAIPEMVGTSRQIIGNLDLEDGRTMDQTPLPWALVNAVKELHAIIAAQAMRIAALEAAQP